MKELLYWIVEWIAKIHSHILRLNDAYEYNFTDKELHFLVIGMMGMGFIFVVYPVFKWLEKHDHVMVIAWIYVLTLIIVITFAIEIGQKASGTYPAPRCRQSPAEYHREAVLLYCQTPGAAKSAYRIHKWTLTPVS